MHCAICSTHLKCHFICVNFQLMMLFLLFFFYPINVAYQMFLYSCPLFLSLIFISTDSTFGFVFECAFCKRFTGSDWMMCMRMKEKNSLIRHICVAFWGKLRVGECIFSCVFVHCSTTKHGYADNDNLLQGFAVPNPIDYH